MTSYYYFSYRKFVTIKTIYIYIHVPLSPSWSSDHSSNSFPGWKCSSGCGSMIDMMMAHLLTFYFPLEIQLVIYFIWNIQRSRSMINWLLWLLINVQFKRYENITYNFIIHLWNVTSILEMKLTGAIHVMCYRFLERKDQWNLLFNN